MRDKTNSHTLLLEGDLEAARAFGALCAARIIEALALVELPVLSEAVNCIEALLFGRHPDAGDLESLALFIEGSPDDSDAAGFYQSIGMQILLKVSMASEWLKATRSAYFGSFNAWNAFDSFCFGDVVDAPGSSMGPLLRAEIDRQRVDVTDLLAGGDGAQRCWRRLQAERPALDKVAVQVASGARWV